MDKTSAPKRAKPRVELQGKLVIERDGDALLIMFPNGDVESAASPKHAERVAKKWFHSHSVDAINVGLIEWRDGIRPPQTLPPGIAPGSVEVPIGAPTVATAKSIKDCVAAAGFEPRDCRWRTRSTGAWTTIHGKREAGSKFSRFELRLTDSAQLRPAAAALEAAGFWVLAVSRGAGRITIDRRLKPESSSDSTPKE